MYGGDTMRKTLTVFSALTIVAVGFAVVLLNPVGPSVIPIAGILEGKVESDVSFEVRFWSNFDQLTAGLSSEDVDIVVLPISIGANLYARGFPIKLVAVNLWKSFYIVGKDIEVNQWEDLAGKEIYTPHGKGQTADVVMRFVAAKHGMTVGKDIKISYASPQEIVSLMSAGKVQLAALPEPFVTLAMKKAGAHIVIDLQELWAKETGYKDRLPITGIFVKKGFFEGEFSTFLSAINALKRSTEYARENPREVAELTTKYIPGMPFEVLLESIKRSLYQYVYAGDVKEEILEYLKAVHSVDPEAIVAIPDEGFFAQ
ncbi:MAG: NitT/TauT family transport system substrate-binding protein [Thermotogota bacterium]|nr:NitT/TauT family transport system substrate-binding protein [Thermotogota bacterium]